MIVCADTDTGYRLSQLLRRENRRVIALMRRRADPSLIEKMGCEIVPCDPTDRDEVNAIFAAHASPELQLVCMLGGSPQLNSQGNLNVIDAAVQNNISRLIMLTSIGCGESIAAVDPFVKAFVGKSLRAKNWAETQLRASELDWTIVRPGGMVRRATRGEPMLVEDPLVSGHINVFDLGDLVHQVLNSDSSSRRTFSAVDSERAYHLQGNDLQPAEL
jgi:nucleoside-diphosphate-sugar epimerase